MGYRLRGICMCLFSAFKEKVVEIRGCRNESRKYVKYRAEVSEPSTNCQRKRAFGGLFLCISWLLVE